MRNLYRETFDELHASDRLRQEVMNMTNLERNTKLRRKFPKTILIAAALVVALTGTAVAAGFIPASLRGWFTQQWQEETGGDISQEHLALIDRLTQEVGVSDTRDGATVTLDSVTCGDSILWLLLKVDLPELAKDPSLYDFCRVELVLSPEPDGENTAGGMGFSTPYAGIAEDGRLTLLVRFDMTLTGEDSLLKGYDATLTLGNLNYDNALAVEGPWELSFTLEPAEQEVLTLDSAVVPARDMENDYQACTVELRNIRITAAGIRYTQAGEDQMLEPRSQSLVLQDGSEVRSSSGGSRWMGEEQTGLWATDFTWTMPVDLSQVVGVRFGDQLIPLN
jgi:hypothetical protein